MNSSATPMYNSISVSASHKVEFFFFQVIYFLEIPFSNCR